MKSCSKQIENVLDNLQNTCSDLAHDKEDIDYLNKEYYILLILIFPDNILFILFSIQYRKQRSIEKMKRNNKYVLAVVIKILQNSPSKIWYHLDNQEYLKAAK
jgi:hypothetical protein